MRTLGPSVWQMLGPAGWHIGINVLVRESLVSVSRSIDDRVIEAGQERYRIKKRGKGECDNKRKKKDLKTFTGKSETGSNGRVPFLTALYGACIGYRSCALVCTCVCVFVCHSYSRNDLP